MTQRSAHQVKMLLEGARESLPHDECMTCECFHGYLVQLSIDAGEEVQNFFDELGIDRRRTHSCMGCDPCPPADLLVEYLRERD